MTLTFTEDELIVLLGVERAEEACMTKKEQLVAEYHHNEIYFSNGEWITYIGHGREGRRKRRRKTRAELIDYLYRYYTGEIDPDEPRKVNSRYTLKRYFEKGLKALADDSRSPETIKRHERVWKTYVTDDFANRDIRQIIQKDITSYLHQVMKERHLKQKELSNLISTLSLPFRIAYHEGVVTHNPALGIDKSTFKRDGFSKPRRERDYITEDEANRLKDECWSRINNPKERFDVKRNAYTVLFLLYTGVRDAEIALLKWTDIVDDTIHVHKQLVANDETLDWLKNELRCTEPTGKYAPIIKPLREVLDGLNALYDEYGIQTDYLFSKKDGTHISKESPSDALRKMCIKLEIACTNIHAIRKYFNTYILEPTGLSAAERGKILGHSAETNLRFYTKPKELDYTSIINEHFYKSSPKSSQIIDFTEKKKALATS